MKTYLMVDPYHDYAARFIEHIFRTYGYRALCACTDRRRRACEAKDYPVLRTKAVARHDEILPDEIGSWALRMAERYEILGVVAFGEETVLPAATITEALQLKWNRPEVLRRFRDKYSLKEHLRTADPTLRINGSMRVTLEDFPQEAPYERFVLKPNDGFAGRSIGIFDRRSPRREIDDYLRAAQGGEVVLEEYVDGEEYFVNGQVDGDGNSTVFGIFRYHRVSANGQPRVMYRIDMVHRGDRVFEPLKRYAIQMMRASGLRRSPFHLEAKVDQQGPCLIECGARLGGHGTAFVCNDAHGGEIDVFAVAAHDYLHDTPQTIPLRWDIYEALDVRYVDAIASGKKFVRGRPGIAAVQKMPTFHSWAIKPRVGVSTRTTRDCLSMPYSAVLIGPRGTDLDRDEAAVRRAMGAQATGLAGAGVRAAALANRIGHALSWRTSWLRSWFEGRLLPGLLDRLRALRFRLDRELESPLAAPTAQLSAAGIPTSADQPSLDTAQ